MANQNNQTTKQKNKRQDADPPARFASHHPKTAKQTAKGARAQQKQPQKRFAKDTVVKTHCVATDSKTCSKRISCHPSVRHAIYIVAKKTKKVAFAIHYRLTQPLRVLSQVLVHVPMFRTRAGTIKRQLEQEKDDVGSQVSSCPPHCRERPSGYDNAVT